MQSLAVNMVQLSDGQAETVAREGVVELSVVVPVFNEAQSLEELVLRIRQALERTGVEAFEVILVDDGSDDSTWKHIEQQHGQDVRIRGLRLARNFGHQNALFAGLRMAAGAAVISLDGDLQHPPELIGQMVERWRQGYYVVAMRRTYPESESWFKRLSSRAFYSVFSYLAEMPLSPGSSDFRLLDRRVLDELLEIPDAQWFMRGVVQWLGFPMISIDYQADSRRHGESKYTFRKMVRFASEAIVSFSNKPLRMALWLGMACCLIAVVQILYAVGAYLAGETVSGWSSLIIMNALLFAALFMVLGVLGAYLARVHRSLQRRPPYVVERSLGGRRMNDDKA
jgi:dolichol-phosphate mannosyltransferase